MPTDNPDPDTAPSSLSKEVLDEADRIASWCEKKGDETLRTARWQIVAVFGILLFGVALILAMPPVIQRIEYIWREDSLPPVVMDRAKATNAAIASNKEEMKSEADSAAETLAATEMELAATQEELQQRKETLRTALTAPYVVWRDVRPDEMKGALSILGLRVLDGIPHAVGRVLTEDVSRAVLLVWNGAAFNTIFPATDSVEIERLTAITAAPDGRVILAGRAGSDAVLIAGRPDAPDPRWTQLWQGSSPNAESTEIVINAIEVLPDGSLIAAGFLQDAEDVQHFLIRSDNGTDWRTVAVDISGTGGFGTSLQTLDGAVLLGGTILDAKNDPGAALIRSENGRTWSRVPLPPDVGRRVWWVAKLMRLPRGEILLGVRHAGGEVGMLTSDNGRHFEPTSINGDIFAATPLADGRLAVLLLRDKGGAEPVLTTYAANETGWSATKSVEVNIRVAFGPNTALGGPDNPKLVEGGAGDLFLSDVTGPNALLKSLTPDEAEAFATDLISDTEHRGHRLEELRGERCVHTDASEGMVTVTCSGVGLGEEQLIDPSYISVGEPPSDYYSIPYEISVETRKIERLIGWSDQLTERIEQQTSFAETTKSSYDRQAEALKEFGALSIELEEALRGADRIRQLAQIVTRLAVIGLLIYVVKIVVNRYRYLHRLAGFYHARAHAFRMLAAQGDSALLSGLSIADITAMLSPDAIGFDKSAEPLAGEIVPLLQAGLRKS